MAELESIVKSLSNIEKSVLGALNENFQALTELDKKTGIGPDSVMRAVAWLEQKGLAEVSSEKKELLVATAKGLDNVKNGLLEKQFIQEITKRKGKATLLELQKIFGPEINFVLGLSKKNAWISVLKKDNTLQIELTGLEKDLLEGNYSTEKALQKIAKNSDTKGLEKEVEELIKRGLAEKQEKTLRKVKISKEGIQAKQLSGKTSSGEINILNSKILASGEWQKNDFRKYNLSDPVPEIWAGKRQPYIQFLSHIRRKLVELGFQEMYAPTIVTEFYNFDVLFQPQNHPARTLTDTYQLKQPKFGKLPDKKIVQAVREAHETGGVSASSGWGYQWSEEIAKKLMPSAHATAHSSRQLTHGVKIPGKYFAIARCYRPDVIDATHLVEFNQMDGFIVGEELNFRHLLGMLKQFAIEVAGAEKVRFYPDYYPFTEPSVQLSAKHPELGWVEFAGAGIFRPELTENQGIKEPVIAWGMGIDRLAMFKLGIKDIRHLFSEDLNYLRNAKMVK
ncbi:MAG: phenylalanine--tRNA ligase subunit alpha [Candidatus Diapherotrites archaeon]|nr:phenylalanine--tRNA ligase subunit alpha [Candidatus Diapherotrites archaeon]